MKLILLVALTVSSSAFAEDILLMGDSLACGPLGMSLYSEMSKNPANHVTVYCTSSSSPVHWLKGENPKGFSCHSCEAPACDVWVQKKMYEGAMPECPGLPAGQTPKIADLLKSKKFGRVMVVLGSNRDEEGIAAPASYKNLASAIQDAGVPACDWIGPGMRDQTKPVYDPDSKKWTDEPSYMKAKMKEPELKKKYEEYRKQNVDYNRTLDQFYSSLESSVGQKCKLFDGRSRTGQLAPEDTLFDGVHPTERISQDWGRAVVSQPSVGVKSTSAK